jgi:hypothetical protein
MDACGVAAGVRSRLVTEHRPLPSRPHVAGPARVDHVELDTPRHLRRGWYGWRCHRGWTSAVS